ncbi:disease resistance protein RGA2-like [Salvia hispanica]|uniref:disease resistance protein RGA2-like n=1 Tax=Salvia hispanica TaxID=49212 RepID=UPI002009D1D2|nr:disease resistance protein RGA2-like [Salvia hispanica]
MGDAIISVVVERVATILNQIRCEVNLIRGVEKELSDLSDKLKTITDVLDDAAKRGVNDHSIKSWLKKLENTAYEMDDILDEWNYSLLKYKMGASDEPEPQPEQKTGCSFIPSPSLYFKKLSDRHSTANKIDNVKAKLAQILKEMDNFKFVMMHNGGLANSEPATNPESKPWREQSTHVIDLTKVYGLDIHSKENDIVSKLMRTDGDTQILSIVGTGGIGKTTLAKVVYNDTRVQGCHALRIWISVSNHFDMAGIAKGILDSVGTPIPPNTNQLALILQKLQESVSGQKFLLVLDDVWTEDESKWNDLKISLQCATGSTILVTTRNEMVAKMMGTLNENMYRPNILSKNECWSLLCDTSLPKKSEEERKEFVETGEKIAIKCKGLPLAAVVLGRLLQFKDLEGWEHVEKSEIWQLENAQVDIFSHLVLSYNDLSPTLKRCFSYCAVYPKGHRIHVESLIEEWMALGYLGPVSANSGVELKGREYLNSLAMRSLFQDIEESKSGEQIEWCKMHDIIHDFALFIRKNDDGASTSSCQVCDSLLVSHVHEYRCLSWDHKLPVNESERSFHFCDCLKSLRVLRFKRGPLPVGMKMLIHLRCLDFSDIALSKDDLKIICRLYFLQTLLLSLCSITEVPHEIGNLVHLRRLALSYNYKLKELPESIRNLVELRSLSIAYCLLKKIPGGIGNLVQLRQLDLSYNIELQELPMSIYNLVELRSLSLSHCFLTYIPGQIGNLVQLRQLDLSWNKELKYLPESIGYLVQLQMLNIERTDIYCLPQAICRLRYLRTLELCVIKVGRQVGRQYNELLFLHYLYGLPIESLELEIHLSSKREMEELVMDARHAELLKYLQELKRLSISFKGRMNENDRIESSSMWMELLKALKPHRELKALKIDGYRGARLLSWMSSPFNLIEEIDLTYLSEVSSLPAMGKLPCLEILSIECAEQLKLVEREFLGIGSSSASRIVAAFPKLRKLKFSKCNRLEHWEDITVEEEESAAISLMPCLTELAITHCESLKKLPHHLLRKTSLSLRLLIIYGSPELVKTYGEDKEGSTWRSISQHNPQLVLRK